MRCGGEVGSGGHSGGVEARPLRYDESGPRYAHMYQGLHRESVSPQAPTWIGERCRCRVQAKCSDVPSPEDVKPVAQVGVAGLVKRIDEQAEHTIAKATYPGDVAAAAPRRKSCAFC